jgi:Ca2+-binding EF-hand superfamily protein
MGCSSSRASRLEELVLIEAQEVIGFSKHKSSYIDQIIRKFSANSHVNERQLQLITQNLEISTTDAEHLRISAAFDKLRGKAGINVSQLLTMGILAGEGTNQEKAQLLFEVYDTACYDEISEENLHYLITDLLFVIVDCLGGLSSQQDVQDYITVINRGVRRYTVFLNKCFKISEAPCSKSGFVEGWQWLAPLTLSPESIRSSIYSQASKEKSFKLKFKQS